MTIKDIARESGYAVGTVSRVLNNNPNVSAAARQHILDIVQKNNFQPNSNAKHLKQQASSGIAVIVKGTRNLLFAGILEKLQSLIESHGYICMLYYIDEEANEVDQAIQVCQERKPFGLLFLGSNLEYFTPSLAELGVPCVLVTSSAATLDISNLSSVGVDDSAAASCMIDYLYDHGHRIIGVIGGRPEISRPSLARLNGCSGAFLRHGLMFDPKRQYACARFSLESGYTAMEQLLQTCPEATAVFTMSDLMAVGALRALHDHGLRVPEDISLSGYDGIELAQYCIPKLTTIRQNVDRLAMRGVDILLHCIENTPCTVHEIVPFELIEGESVKSI
jgi:LacI family transcriptional regulator